MQKITDRESLIELATRYYKDGMSQEKLAKLYGVSRPTIANLIKRCHDEGVVEIRIAASATSSNVALAGRLREEFNLKHVELISPDDSLSEDGAVGKHGAEFVSSLLKDNMNIGLSWGSSLYTVIQNIPQCHLINSNAIQTMGGFGGTHNINDGYSVLSNFAKATNATSKMVLAPLLVQNKDTRNMLVEEKSIHEALEMMSTLDLILVGVGSATPSENSLVMSGFIDVEEALGIQTAGGIGLICGYHYDINGKVLNLPLNDRIIGIKPEEITNTKEVVGIAWGKHKVMPILGAIRGGLITSLVTTEETALSIINAM